MTVNEALSIINKTIEIFLQDYAEDDANYKNVTANDGTTSRELIKNRLHFINDDDKLFALDVALKDIALNTVPLQLLEANGSVATELKRVNTDYYVRVPAYPEKDRDLDIDVSLAYAVVFNAIGNLYSGFNKYLQKSSFILNSFNIAYKSTLKEILAGGTISSDVAYIRFSADNENWNTSYSDGDTYISFKRIDSDSWSTGIKFVGSDGTSCSDTNLIALNDTPATYEDMAGKIVAVKSTEDGIEFIDPSNSSGASTFKDLTDTPNDFTGNKGKIVSVNNTEDGLEFIDAPSGSSAVPFNDVIDGNDSATGDISLNLYDKTVTCRWYFELSGDTNLIFNEDDNGLQGADGRIYVFQILPNGYNFTWDSNISWQGDASITTNAPQILTAFYDGLDWYVISKTSY